MTIVAVTSLHGSPGVSTLAVELASYVGRSASVLLLEADPDGGVLAARHGLKLQPCLTDLCSAARHTLEAETVWRHAQPLHQDARIVVAHPSAEATSAALRAGGPRIAATLKGLDADVVIDPGRLRPSSPARPLLDVADTVLVVVRPELAEVMVVLHGLEWIRERVLLAVTGATPYSPRQVADVTGLRVAAVLGAPGGTGRRRSGDFVQRLTEALELRKRQSGATSSTSEVLS